MKTADFDYDLPGELIAQAPADVRDACRMLVLSRETGAVADRIFRDIAEYLRPGDLLVANETRVIPARLLGRKRGTGGEAEVLLLRECASPLAPGADRPELRTNRVSFWEALVRPGKRLKPGAGAIVDFADADGNVALSAEVVGWANADSAGGADATGVTGGAKIGGAGITGVAASPTPGQRGERIVRLSTELDSLDDALHRVGRAPLPPYIKGYAGSEEMYQTVYSQRESSAAAPTAGLHFTPELIERLRAAGVAWETVELEVGLDTFRIVDEENAEDHAMHTERYTVPERTVAAIERTKRAGGRAIAVGTTSVRSLESAAALAHAQASDRLLVPTERAATSLYIMPGYDFRVVDAMVTNFHVPRSTLMMLVSAFAGHRNVMRAYAHAVAKRYRFLSFGDAMLIV